MSALDDYRKEYGGLLSCESEREKGEYLVGLGYFVQGWDAREKELEVIRKNMKEATDMIKFIIKYYDETVDGLWVQNAITNLAKWRYK